MNLATGRDSRLYSACSIGGACVISVSIAAAVAIAVAGCAKDPLRADWTETRRTALATEYDARRSDEAALGELVRSIGLASDPALQRYVQAVGSRLVPFAPSTSFSYRFEVLDVWTPNALSLPGGSIVLTRGLVAIASSEDELAAALAHEISHVSHRHAAAREALGEKPIGVKELYWASSVAGYARDQERDADRGGQALAAAAGYDPLAAAELLRKLDAIERAESIAASIPSFFATHPSAVERAAATAATGQQIAWTRRPGIANDRAAYLDRITGLVVGDDQNQCAVHLQGYHFLYPALDLAIRFPLFGWTLSCSATSARGTAENVDAVLEVTWTGSREAPAAAAQDFLARAKSHGLDVIDARALEIEDRDAFGVRVWHAGTSIGGEHIWMAYQGLLYHLLAAVPSNDEFEGILSSASATAHSFRALTPEERQSIQIERLALATAQEGESLADLGKRVGNTWSATYTAAMNGVALDVRLGAGQRMKVAVAQKQSP